ncbi:peritrophin-44 [Zeugodacus cucurbitae]|uniref:Peritrophin-48 n=1 Tax=Zeugodacus cucurbitae TaxID=28588 RepID=A0A0A1WQI9_ZEUCU|nr:peritrophin-44 [Zeugodacus cucurbitae]
MLKKSLLLLSLIFCYLHDYGLCVTTLPDPTELCGFFKDGIRLRKPGSCTEYIHCSNSTGVIYSCPSPQKFDRKAQRCVLESNLSDVDDYCRNRCLNINDKWVTDPATCKGYFYCKNGQPIQGYCTNGYYFNEAKSMCDFENVKLCNIVPEICDLVPDGTKYRSSTNCNSYYICNNGKSQSKTCPNYYNLQTESCVKNLPDYPCVPKFKCSSSISGTKRKGFFTDGISCRGYFLCRDFGKEEDLEPLFLQCPVGKLFDGKTQSCTEPYESDCKFDRCQGQGDRLVQTNDDNCRSYITCRNGEKINTKRCSGDKFFDEKLQACVYTIISYKSCDGINTCEHCKP